MLLIVNPTRNLFFTGKGGVGKTSLACATAVTLADRGKKVLLVSTDPASNLDEVLGVHLTSASTSIPGVPNLSALNIDPEAAARAYRERVVGPYRGILPEASVSSIEEQLSGACTTEIAAFDEFARLLGDATAPTAFDHVVVDTAPTGHTLRLLLLPAAWSDFIESNAGGTSCLGPLSGLQTQQELYASTVRALSDPKLTTLVLVSRPERAALQEAERTRHELSAVGISNQHFVLNGVFIAQDRQDPIAVALEARGKQAVSGMPAALAKLPQSQTELLPFGLIGTNALRALLQPSVRREDTIPSFRNEAGTPLPGLSSLVRELEQGGRGVIMVMGKGGVGKTTVAAAIAVALADHGHTVQLTTTDPAGQVQSALAQSVNGLSVSRIDPVAETQAYREEVMRTAGDKLDEQGRRLLEEELRSPCTEEMAVFRSFALKVAEGTDSFVVLDTAPTGHTLLLLDATEAYHRQVSHTMSDIPDSVRQLLPRLRDHEYTKMIIVTLPEATPVHEAAQLQQDLKRAEITPFAWVINQCLSPLTVTDRILKARQASEGVYIDEVRRVHALSTYMIPWMEADPTVPESLRQVASAITVGKPAVSSGTGR